MTYTVLTPLLHDGIHYRPGDAIELDEAAAAPLLARGRIEQRVEEETRANDKAPARRPAKAAG